MIRVRQSRDGSVAVDSLDDVLFEVGDSGNPELAESLRWIANHNREVGERWQKLEQVGELAMSVDSLRGWVSDDRVEIVARMLLSFGFHYEPEIGSVIDCGIDPNFADIVERGCDLDELAEWLLCRRDHDGRLDCRYCQEVDEWRIANLTADNSSDHIELVAAARERQRLRAERQS